MKKSVIACLLLAVTVLSAGCGSQKKADPASPDQLVRLLAPPYHIGGTEKMQEEFASFFL